MTAPAIVFTYNRAEKTKLTLDALNNNTLAPDTDLIIFCDAYDPGKENDLEKTEAVKKVLYDFKKVSRFRSVRIYQAEKHFGLARSVINGVNQVMNEYGSVIVTEDDLVSHKNYLEYMNEALEYYKDDQRVWSISGYSYDLKCNEAADDVYFTYRGSSWGWATWKDRWDQTDWTMKDYDTILRHPKRLKNLNRAGRDLLTMLRNQKNHVVDSWAVRWVFEQTRNAQMTVYPAHTFLYNIGLDGSGSHKVADGNDQWEDLDEVPYHLIPVKYDPEKLNEFAQNYEDPYFGTVEKFR
ncbi:MAG: glycosyltransferase family 2 protein [Solobacterium sp.]|nr:glycosyltransferase family 2 protein [Solobacterium sp.]